MASLVNITGVVQGVGFRPHIYRRAISMGYSGWVANNPAGVQLYLELDRAAAQVAIAELLTNLPAVARVEGYSVHEVPSQHIEGFSIASSEQVGEIATEISRDLAICGDCLAEMRDPRNRRYGYPYITCTNCGPRYSVITALPYDRENTTMAPWAMCDACLAEYRDPMDRRFHAEPIACWDCGPNFVLYKLDPTGDFAPTELSGSSAISAVAKLFNDGGIVAIKGIGGYHLAADASNEISVDALRQAKFRKDKPFAVMAQNLDRVQELCEVSATAKESLLSSGAPIVIMPSRLELPGVAPDSDQLGVMLAYTPLHHLLFDAGAPKFLVMTSANRSSEPISYLDSDALERLAGIASAILVGERPIARRLDDSVCFASGRAPLLRRSKGLSPGFVADIGHAGPIVACGADLKSTVAVAFSHKVLVSQYLGDLQYHEVQLSHRRTVADLIAMYKIDRSSVLLCTDAHPQYFSGVLAQSYAEEFGAREPVRIQHHRAHIASVLAEHSMWHQDVVGVALDGTGYGDDASIWGGEFFAGSLSGGFERVTSIGARRLLGGEAAARRPIQALAGYLQDESVWRLMAKDVFGIDPSAYRALSSLRVASSDAIATTSAGRLFDSVAAICGFGTTMTYEGQAAMWLESIARSAVSAPSDFTQGYRGSYRMGLDDMGRLDYGEMLAQAIEERLGGVDVSAISMRFHVGFGEAVATLAARIAQERQSEAVVLSGGVFQNRVFTQVVIAALGRLGHRVKMNESVSCNDEGISLGQVAIAAAQFSKLETSAAREAS